MTVIKGRENMTKKKKLIISISAIVVAVIIAAVLLFIFIKPSNGKKYDVSGCTVNTSSPLYGKTFYWLGSSVTLGMRSQNQAVPDFLAARNGCVCKKEAVSGTTLFDVEKKGQPSYVSRLKSTTEFDKGADIDAFICQISTNDAKSEFSSLWGEVSQTYYTDPSQIDTGTTAGAMEFVVTYVEKTWDCPIYFYSGSYFTDSGVRGSKDPSRENYEKIIDLAEDVAKKWNEVEGYQIEIIDLFHDEEFNAISDEDYKVYMHDPVHPYKAGYLLWWTPAFEEVFFEDFGK